MKISKKKAIEIQAAIDAASEARAALDSAALDLEQLTNRVINAADFEGCTVQEFFDGHTVKHSDETEFKGTVHVEDYV